MSVIINIFFIALSLLQTQGTFLTLRKFFPFSSQIQSWDFQDSHLVASFSDPSKQIEFYNLSSGVIRKLKSPSSFATKISSFIDNTAQNYCLLVVYNYTNFSILSQNSACRNTPAFNQQIQGVISTMSFGELLTDYQFTVRDTRQGRQKYIWSTAFNISTYQHIGINMVLDCKFYNGSYFYTVQNRSLQEIKTIQVWRMSSQNEFENLLRLQYFNCPYLKIDLKFGIFLISCGQYVQVRNSIYPFQLIKNISVMLEADEVIIMNYHNFIVKSQHGVIQQYDFDGNFMDVKVLKMQYPNYIRRINDSSFFYFSHSRGYTLSVSSNIFCQILCDCPSHYVLNGSECAYQNISELSQRESNLSAKIRTTSYALGNSLSIASSRFISKSNIPVSIFVQEFWLYKYFAGVNYPDAMDSFLNQIQIINYLKLRPDFLDIFETNASIGNSTYYNTLYKSDQITYETLYFTEALKQFYTFTIIINVILYIVLKFSLVFFPKKTSCGVIGLVRQSIVEKTSWWPFIMNLIESDFVVLCFYCLNQITLSYFYTFENKINLMTGVTFYYILVFHGIIGYTLIHEFYENKSKGMLVFSKGDVKTVFCLQSTVILTLKLLKSFAHSAAFTSPIARFLLIISLDFAIILFIFQYRRLFFCKGHFTMYILYQIGVVIINILLLIKLCEGQQKIPNFEEIFQGCLIGLIVVSGLKFILTFYKLIHQTIISLTNNKILPQESLKQSKKSDVMIRSASFSSKNQDQDEKQKIIISKPKQSQILSTEDALVIDSGLKSQITVNSQEKSKIQVIEQANLNQADKQQMQKLSLRNSLTIKKSQKRKISIFAIQKRLKSSIALERNEQVKMNKQLKVKKRNSSYLEEIDLNKNENFLNNTTNKKQLSSFLVMDFQSASQNDNTNKDKNESKQIDIDDAKNQEDQVVHKNCLDIQTCIE